MEIKSLELRSSFFVGDMNIMFMQPVNNLESCWQSSGVRLDAITLAALKYERKISRRTVTQFKWIGV